MKAITDTGVRVELLDDGTWMTLQPDTIGEAESGFRSVPWGSAKEAALARELGEPGHQSETLLYWSEQYLASLEVDIVYIYAADVLVRAKYRVTSEFANNNRYLNEFHSLHALLSKKYGPMEPEYLWLSNIDWEPEEYGLAVSSGQLIVSATWQVGDTQIFLGVSGENYEIDLTIEYSSVELAQLESSLKEAAVIADL